MTFRLKSDVHAQLDGKMVVYEAGVAMSSIPKSVVAQLAPDHFRDEDGNLPDDWRPQAAQAKDDQQRAFLDEYIATHVKPREDT
jgi:hypothetical protein